MVVVEWLVRAAGAYLAVGLVFAVAFVARGVRRIDPAAAGGTLGFRLLILPGAAALWPLLLRRWVGGAQHPPAPRDAHRRAASAPASASAEGRADHDHGAGTGAGS